MRQRIRDRIHADVGVEKHVQPLVGDEASRDIQPAGRKRNELIGPAADELRDLVLGLADGENRDGKLLAVELIDQPHVQPADGVVAEEARDEADVDFFAGGARRGQRRIGRRIDQCGEVAVDRQIIPALIGEGEQRRRGLVGDLELGAGRFELRQPVDQALPPALDLFQRIVDGRQEGDGDGAEDVGELPVGGGAGRMRAGGGGAGAQQSHGVGEGFGCLIQPALVLQRRCQILMSAHFLRVQLDRSSRGGGGVLQKPQLLRDERDVHLRHHEIRPKLRCATMLRQRFFQPPELSQRRPEVHVPQRVVRIDFDGPTCGGDGVVQSPQHLVGRGQVAKCFGVIGLHVRQPLPCLRPRFQMSGIREDQGRQEQRRCGVRIESQRRLRLGQGRVRPARGAQRRRQVRPDRRHRAVDRYGAGDQLDGVGVMAGLVRDQAEQLQRVKVVGIVAEHLAIDLLRLAQASRLLMLKSDLHRLIERYRIARGAW